MVHCSGESSKPGSGNTVNANGSVALQLQLPGGTHADTAHFVINHASGFHREGDIDVSQSSTVSAFVGGIPAGAGYTLDVTLASTDASVSCAGNATFSVASAATTVVDVILRCRSGKTTGSILINGTLNLCPTIDLIGALPLTAAFGSSIELKSAASDLDNVPNPTTYTWSDFSGFNATTPNATFVCTAPGLHTIALTVSDGDPGCEAVARVNVTCLVPDGGFGGSSGQGGAAGAGQAGSSGSAGQGGAAGAAGGDGGHIVTVEEILAAKSSACLSCAQTNCASEVGGCIALRGQSAAAGPSVGASREVLCTNALACVIPPGASTSCGVGFLNACYCGSALNEACLTNGNADGVCKSQLESGLESTEAATIAVAFTHQSLGGGAAMFLAQCLNDSCDNCFQP